MTDTPKITEVLEWCIAPWIDKVIIPTDWATDDIPPSERGPFFIIHCDFHDTALHVCELLNEEAERVLRTVIEDGPRS